MLSYLLVLTEIAGLIFALMIILGTSLFDIKKIASERSFKRHPYTKQHQMRPLISIVVRASDNEILMEQCLDSLMKSSYQKIEIIVVDTFAHQKMHRWLKSYTKENKKRPMAIFKSKQPINHAMTRGYRRYGKGDIILFINGSDRVDRFTCAQLVRRFNADQRIQAIQLNTRIVSHSSVTGLFQTYANAATQLLKKMLSAFNSPTRMTYEHIAYRKDVLSQATLPSDSRIGYADSAIIYQSPLSLFKFLKRIPNSTISRLNGPVQHRPLFTNKRLRFQILLYSVIEVYLKLIILFLPILLSYFIYLAFYLHQPTLFVLSLIVISVYLLYAIWLERQTPVVQKVFHSILIPITYIFIYIMSLIEALILIGSAVYLFSHRKMSTRY